MYSIAEERKLIMFGLANLPDNFSIFDYDKKQTWFSSLKKQIKDSGNNKDFLGVSVSKNQALQIDDSFIKLFEKYFPNYNLVVDVTNSGLFNKEEFCKIFEVKEKLNKSKLRFCESFTIYDFDEVCKANEKLNTWADEINNLTINGKKLSPLEKYYVAYNYITRFNYHESKTNQYDSRNLVDVLNGNDIVCVGYARMLQALCSRIGIECKVQKIGFDKAELNHMNCQVSIKDDKYNIDGIFYSDPCFDSKDNGTSCISHALISYNDVRKTFMSHWIKFDNSENYDFNNDITSYKKSNTQTTKDLGEFLNSQKHIFSDYIDSCLKDKKNFFITSRASKKDLKAIIDKMIEDCLLKVNFGNVKSNLNSYSSSTLDKINMYKLANMILTHTKTKNIEAFKEKVFREMQSYIPPFDSYTFNILTDAFVRYNTNINNQQITRKKDETRDLSFDNFDKLIQNLKNIKGESECFSPNKIDDTILASVKRANAVWGKFSGGQNIFSLLSNLYSIQIRENGYLSVQTGEDILQLGRNVISKHSTKSENNEPEQNIANTQE